jgi:TATA-box binding protein (TBP) (component of TFIID and TFIIIB)
MQATKAFISNLQNFRASLPVTLRPTVANVTTITMIARAPKPLNPDVLRAVFRKLRYLPITGGSTWRMFYSDFYNQVSIGYEDKLSTKKVKIFPNGALQVAGCADLIDCRVFTRQLCLILRIVYNVDMTPEDFRIVMINANFSLNHSINLYRATELFQNASFDPDRYSAVKIKYRATNKQTTTSIFASGAVIVTGANTIEDIMETYKFIVQSCIQGGVFVEANDQSDKFSSVLGFSSGP